MSTATAAPSKTYKGMPQTSGNFDHQIFFSLSSFFCFFFLVTAFPEPKSKPKQSKERLRTLFMESIY